jgi:hypothetical protein
MAIVVAIDHAFLPRTPRHVMLSIRIPLSPQARFTALPDVETAQGERRTTLPG